MHFDLFERYHLYVCNFGICVFGSMYICVISIYVYLVRCINVQLQCICTRFDVTRYDVHMCNFDLYECGSIYIFLISMYIYTVRCLYVEFRCICVRFDDFVRNGTPYNNHEGSRYSKVQIILCCRDMFNVWAVPLKRFFLV